MYIVVIFECLCLHSKHVLPVYVYVQTHFGNGVATEEPSIEMLISFTILLFQFCSDYCHSNIKIIKQKCFSRAAVSSLV